jgi:transcriptional regulator with XRE-family HTH domain
VTQNQKPFEKRRQPITAKEYGPDPVDVHVGSRLRLRRTLLGLSQEQLAAAVGVTFQQIQKYERGSNRVSASRLYDIARVMGVPIQYFFEDIDDQVTGKRPTQNLPAMAGLSEMPQAPFEQDPMKKNETLELVHAYWRLPSDDQREAVLKMLKAVGRRD